MERRNAVASSSFFFLGSIGRSEDRSEFIGRVLPCGGGARDGDFP